MPYEENLDDSGPYKPEKNVDVHPEKKSLDKDSIKHLLKDAIDLIDIAIKQRRGDTLKDALSKVKEALKKL